MLNFDLTHTQKQKGTIKILRKKWKKAAITIHIYRTHSVILAIFFFIVNKCQTKQSKKEKNEFTLFKAFKRKLNACRILSHMELSFSFLLWLNIDVWSWLSQAAHLHTLPPLFHFSILYSKFFVTFAVVLDCIVILYFIGSRTMEFWFD